MSPKRLHQLTDKFLTKAEENAAAEGIRMLQKSNLGKLRLVGFVLGVIFVGLIALWMARHSEKNASVNLK